MNNFFQNKKVLVTGAGGFIGSHLTEALVQSGANLRAFLHYDSQNSLKNLSDVEPSILERVEIFRGNIDDPFTVGEAVKGCSIVFHLAALIGIPYSYVAPQQYVTTNVLGTLNILEACHRLGIEKLVHTSTSETYGTARYAPIDELHSLNGQSPYAATKIGADKLAESYFLSFSLPVATIRPFNTFGPRQSSRAVIPTIISQALMQDEIHIGCLTPVRDFNYVKDIAAAFMAVAASPKTAGEVVNAGSGLCVSIGEILSTIQNLVGVDKPVILDESRNRPQKSEVMNLQCDNRKIKALTGWSPSVSLSEGLNETIHWAKSNLRFFSSNQYAI